MELAVGVGHQPLKPTRSVATAQLKLKCCFQPSCIESCLFLCVLIKGSCVVLLKSAEEHKKKMSCVMEACRDLPGKRFSVLINHCNKDMLAAFRKETNNKKL